MPSVWEGRVIIKTVSAREDRAAQYMGNELYPHFIYDRKDKYVAHHIERPYGNFEIYIQYLILEVGCNSDFDW